jgi:MFS family permease
MSTLTPSPLLLSLLSTAASLPFFLLTFPAGALADTMDRKKLLCGMNLWLALVAGSLAILGWLHLLNPWVILSAVFLLGVGFACNAPAWTSVILGCRCKRGTGVRCDPRWCTDESLLHHRARDRWNPAPADWR